MPERIQLSRKKGWRKPENTVVVARPSKWGNPFAVGKQTVVAYRIGAYIRRAFVTAETRAEAVELYADWIDNYSLVHPAPPVDLSALRGKNLACWCPLDQPCHADVLLELANPEVEHAYS